MANKTIKVREKDNLNLYLPIKLEQNFDFINIMSLTLTQKDIYTIPSANYGILVGRVKINGNIGVPNAKVCVFIPLDEEDIKDDVISSIYPYTSTTDKNSDGIIYNLLPNNKQHYYHVPVGTFPSKDELSSNKELNYIYKKYYKYTVTTNSSGDYMITNIPIGKQTIFMNCDISDIGNLSQKPYNFIYQGYSENLFDSKTKFKKSKTIENLPQIFNQTEIIDIKPFWGDDSISDMVGINRKDFNINYTINPTCFFIGSMYRYDHDYNYNQTDNTSSENNTWVKTDCTLSTHKFNNQDIKNIFRFSSLKPAVGKIEISILLDDGSIEYININNGYVVDQNGVWCIQIPMRSGWKTMNDSGNLIDSETGVGIATYSNVRIRFSTENTDKNLTIQDAYFIAPTNTDVEDYRFTKDDYRLNEITTANPFNGKKMEYNKIYTIKNTVGNYCSTTYENNGVLCGIPTSYYSNYNLFPYNLKLGVKTQGSNSTMNYLQCFTGLINGFMFFIPFQVYNSNFCNCKATYNNMSIIRIKNDFSPEREQFNSTGLIYKNSSNDYYYYYQNHYNSNYIPPSSYTMYCGITEIGSINPNINISDYLPSGTSAKITPTNNQNQYNTLQGEIGVDVFNSTTITNSNITGKQQRVLLMQKATNNKYVTTDNIENETWFNDSNFDDSNYTKFIETPNSFYHYYGLFKGKTAIDILKNEYILV